MGFVAIWADLSTGTFDVRGQMFNADGTKSGPEFLVNTTTSGHQSSPAVAALPDGGFVVSFDDSSAGNFDVRAQIFDADGTPRGNEFVANTVTALNQGDADVAALTNGNFVVTWNIQNPGDDVRAQIFSPTGTFIGGEILVTASISADDTPAIAALAGGGFVVTWEGQFTDTTDIGARRYDAAGNPIGAAFQVNTVSGGFGVDVTPTITALAGGGFVVTWEDRESLAPDSFGFGVRARVYDASGVPVAADFNATTIRQGDQAEPSVAALPDGRFVLSWTDSSQAGGETGKSIHAQVFNADGSKAGTEFFVNTTFLDQLRSSVSALLMAVSSSLGMTTQVRR